MTDSNHKDCCTDCQERTLFWLDSDSELIQEFAEVEKDKLAVLTEQYYNSACQTQEEEDAIRGMKDLYHAFLQQKENLSEEFRLEQMRRVSESLKFDQSQKETQTVSVSV